MPHDFTTRAAAEERRTPPGASVAQNECTPPGQLDAKLDATDDHLARSKRLETVTRRLYIMSNMLEGFEQMLYDPTNKVGAVDMMVNAQSAMCALIAFAETDK